MTSEARPATTTVGGWAYRQLPILLLLTGCTLAFAAGLATPWAKHAPAAAVVAYLTLVLFVSIWLFYRICRMGVCFDDHGVTVRKFFRTYRLAGLR